MFSKSKIQALEAQILDLKIKVALQKAQIEHKQYVIDDLKNKLHRLSQVNHNLIGKNLILSKILSN